MSSEVQHSIGTRSTDEDAWVKVVASLIRQTEEGRLKWTSEPAPQSLREQLVDGVFTTDYEGKRLRLYKKPRKVPPGIQYTLPIIEPYWIEVVVLELGDALEQGWYAIPKTEAARQLLESVEYQVYGVDDFVSKVLDGD